jgi:hypothetical protein
VRPLWSQTVSSTLRGLSAAHERGWHLLWDAGHTLFLYDRAGQQQAEGQTPGDLASACAAADGRSFAAVGEQGQVWLLAPDLTPRWQRSIAGRATAVAVDCTGERIAVAGSDGTLHLFDQAGTLLWKNNNPRPLHFISFVPERPALVGSADFGLVACFEEAGRCVWRDGLVAHSGSLTTTGDGGLVVLACFSEGACCYGLAEGPKSRRFVPAVAPCRLLASTYAGEVWLTVGLGPQVTLHGADGTTRAEVEITGRAVAVALNAMGSEAAVATADGVLMAFDLR